MLSVPVDRLRPCRGSLKPSRSCADARSGSSSACCTAPTSRSPSPGGSCSPCVALLPAAFAIAMGVLVGAVAAGRVAHRSAGRGRASSSSCSRCSARSITAVSANLGDRTAAWLYDRLTEACVEPARHGPPGGSRARRGHDRGPRLRPGHDRRRRCRMSMDFIAGGLVSLLGGLASAARAVRVRLVGAAACWAAPGWPPTGCCARAACGATATPTRCGRPSRTADYAYRLAVDPPAAKEVRLFGLADWVLDRFVTRRRRLHQLQYEATRLRERSVADQRAARARRQRAGLLVAGPAPRSTAGSTSATWWSSRRPRSAPSLIAFGGLNWALDGAAAPVAAVLRARPEGRPRPARCRAGDRRRRRRPGPGDPVPRRELPLPGRRRGSCSTAST